MATPDDVPLGPESKIRIMGELFDFVDGNCDVPRRSHPLNDDSNPNFDQSKPGRMVMNLNWTGFAKFTQKPVADLQIMAANVDYVDVQVFPYGEGEGGDIHSPTFEWTQLSFRSPAGDGGPVMVTIQGHSSGDLIFG
jgi:hypothetical protein